jgi:hypothetical protein
MSIWGGLVRCGDEAGVAGTAIRRSIMTTTLTCPPPATHTAGVETRPLWRPALVAGVTAAAATTAIAAIAHAAGVSFETNGATIPLLGFAEMTLLGAVLGLVIARLSRRAAQPRALFVRITVVLTGLSFVPDVATSFDAASRIVLVATHVAAAIIVVAVLARRLPTTR